MSTRIVIFFLLLLPHSTYAGEVPTELFGVTLGMTATRTQDNPAGEMTIKRLTGLAPWSRGARYYYEPEQASEAFPFLEYRVGEEKFYSTNYSSLVLPVIPAEVNTVSEWEEYGSQHGEQFTVLTVEYTSQEYGSTHAAYLAASALCQEKSAELALEPSRESDNLGSGPSGFARSCFFVTDNRELEINQNGPKYVYRLIFSYEYISLAEKVVAEKINAMQLNVTNAMTDQKGEQGNSGDPL
jgi:hypothetical protein